MKIVFASTPGQEQEICDLMRYIYSNIFPFYFTDEEIFSFERLNILQTSKHTLKEISTLKDAFQVMASMQTIISILDSPQLNEQYASVFNKNAANLKRFGLFFPFDFEQFSQAKGIKDTILSIYTKANNELLV